MSVDKRKDNEADMPNGKALELDRLSERFKKPEVSQHELDTLQSLLRSNIKSGNLYVPEQLLNPHYEYFWALIDSDKPYNSQKYYNQGYQNFSEEEAMDIRAACTDTSSFNKTQNGVGGIIEIKLSSTVTQRLIRIPKQKYALIRKAYDDQVRELDQALGKGMIHQDGIPIQSITETVHKEQEYRN